VEYQHVCIEAVSYVVPETEVTTADLEQRLGPLYRRLGIARGFLEAITGIRARRIWDPGIQPSEVATRAAERALAEANIPREKIDVLVSTSVCKDYIEPSVASLVHGNLGLRPHCLNFDVGNACLGFLTGMITVANMIELGQVDVGLVVAGEGSRTVTESTVRVLQDANVTVQGFRDNLATLTLGSGAAAMVLTHERTAKQGHRFLGGLLRAATEHSRLCVGTETLMTTDPPRLLQEGVRLARSTWDQTKQALGIDPRDITEYALHQVGKANHEAVVRTLEVPDERALRVYPELGNIGAAGVPITLARALEQGRVENGDLVALMGIGSGLNVAMLGVRW
jgi:acyl-CoA:acyl-CoA alkyltransferase